MTSPDAAEPPTTPVATTAEQARRQRTIRFFVALGVAGVVAVAAILVAVALNHGSGSKPITPATIAAGPVVSPSAQSPSGQGALPPLAIVLDRTDAARSMAANNQIIALHGLLATKPTSTIYLDLGQEYMAIGDQTSALTAFAHAAALAPNTPEPLVGLAMTGGMSGTAGLDQASQQLTTLASRFPTNQVVTFNQGWLALYRRDPATVRDAWRRTVALGPKTNLGATAAIFLTQIAKKTSK